MIYINFKPLVGLKMFNFSKHLSYFLFPFDAIFLFQHIFTSLFLYQDLFLCVHLASFLPFFKR